VVRDGILGQDIVGLAAAKTEFDVTDHGEGTFGADGLSAPRPLDRAEQLMALVCAGDESAFRELVELHVDKAFALALRILRNAADAEDVVQDTFVKIWAQPARWQPGRARFSTWLYRVVTNRCLDLCRKPKTGDIDDAPEVVDAGVDALSMVHTLEVHGLLDRAMSGLPPQQRIALILSYHDDLSNPEIAQVMDTTVAAVESLLKRGRNQLRAVLRGHEGDIRESFTGN
jgi:RNA polymerase sigma-70 factor (ECF subfamily)